MVADPRDPERRRDSRFRLPCPLLLKHVQRISPSANRGQHQSENLSTPPATPAKQTMGEWIGGIPGELVGAEPAHTGLSRYRRQPRPEPEAVRQPGQIMGPFRKCGSAELLTQLKLLPERRGADQNTVGFNPGPIDRLPSASEAGRPDRLKECRAVRLQPGIESGCGMGEAKVGIRSHQVQRRSEGPFSGHPGVRNRPQPSEVKVGMPQPVLPGFKELNS